MVLSSHDGVSYNDPESPIYAELERQIPSVPWKSTDLASSSGWRLYFRDAQEPWSATGVVFFDNATGTISITDLGKKLASGVVSPADVFLQAMEAHTEGGENPFRILAAAFLYPEAAGGLPLEKLMGGVMQNFRPDVDDLSTALTSDSGAPFSPTAQRRFKHMLRMLESVGAIAEKDNSWIAWNTAYLQRLTKLPTHTDISLPSMVGQFCNDCEDAGLRAKAEVALRLIAACGSKKFLILSGLAGSGKTKLAQALTRWITPYAISPDPFTPGSKIESERSTYYVNASDEIAVEFWNSEKEEEATKATLPREMINEWAAYITTHGISRETPARDIREAVKGTSKYSDQLHSFETHLKAAAFAVAKASTLMLPAKCYEVVPVGADWTGNENVLGYPDGLRPPKLKTDGSVEEPGAYVTKPPLDLILHATDHPNIPHFLILDEMNLSHVERYFADILSTIESDEKIQLHHDATRKANGKPVPEQIALPKNLFIIGTVNVDETTYMFSPKVLDRANVIEFRMEEDEVEFFLGNPAKPDLSKLDSKGAAFGKAFVEAANGQTYVPPNVKAAYEAEMLLFFKSLKGHGAEFGYRVAHEAARFVHFYKLLGNYPDGDTAWFSGAFDCVVFQKFLPKLHGSRAKLGPLLKSLWFLTVSDAAGRGSDPLKSAEEAARSTEKRAEPSLEIPSGAPYPLSAEKIGRMWRLLNENGFASFAEA